MSDTRRVGVLAAAGAGFLLAVLWFDLMFDTQVLGYASSELPVEVRHSIADYYRRVTTTARPMSYLVAAVMVVTIVALVGELVGGDVPRWAAWTSLALTGLAVGLAALRTLPNAVRLGTQSDSPERQSELARTILREHVACFTAISIVLVIQLAVA